MRRRYWTLIALAIAGLTIQPSVATAQQAPATDGLILALSCAACHGTGGRSPGAIPTLQGKAAPFIEQTLMDFKSGAKPATVMGRLARGYSDDEIKALAAYFGAMR